MENSSILTFVSVLYLLITCLSAVKGQNPNFCAANSSACYELVQDANRTFPTYRNLTTPQLIQRLGYPAESYNRVVTEDGYILTLFRVPYSTKSPRRTGKIPVFLMHGIASSSVQWVWQEPARNLLFMLVDNGFDVWIGNARGTSYSINHVSFPSNDYHDTRYWDFSYHEMGYYDIPAVINFITNHTRQPSLYYIGHSMGTTQFFSGMMMRPELAPKIRTMFSLATSVFQKNAYNPFFRSLVPVMAPYQGEQVVDALFGGQMLPYLLRQSVSTEFCTQLLNDCGICYSVYALLFGVNICQVDFTTLPGVLAHLPDTTSVRVGSHISQDMQYGTFRQYDYGIVKNLMRYRSPIPPDYNWANYNVPTVIYWGLNDNIAVPVDVFRTASAIGPKNLKQITMIDDPLWSHMDFVLGKDADHYLYNDMLNIMRNQTWG